MLIPVGLDDSKVNRVPVVSVAIVALCLFAYVISIGRDNNAEQALREAIFYYYAHRGLEMPPKLAEYLPKQDGENARFEEVHARGEEEGNFDPSWLVPEDTDPAALEEMREEWQRELNHLADLAVQALENRFEMRWGYVPARPSLIALITSMFLHGGLFHLLGNMLFFYFTAPFLEDRWGRPFFAAFYLLGGAVAALGFAMHQPDSLAPLIGASGAIAAVMGAFAVKLGTRQMRFVVWAYFIRYGFSSPAWIVLPFFFAQDLGRALAFGSGTGIAYWAHVYGFAFGAAVAYGVKASGFDRTLNPGIFDPDYPERHPLQGSEHLLRAGKPQEALRLLADCHAKLPDYEELAYAYWNLALELRDETHAQRVGRRLLGTAVRDGRLDEALGLWNHLSERIAPPLEGPDFSRLVELMVKNKRDKEALRLIWGLLNGPNSDQYGAQQYLALTVAATKVSPDAAREIASCALALDLTPKHLEYMRSVVAWADQIAAVQSEPAAAESQPQAGSRMRLSDD